MAFPEKVLSQGEHVVKHLHPHLIALLPAALWFIVICAAAGFGIGYAPADGTAHKVLITAIIVVAVLLICWLCVAPWLRRQTTHYVITNRRVLVRRGVLNHQGHDIQLANISYVEFRQSLWDRIMRAGTLIIDSSADIGHEELEGVPDSAGQQQLLNRLIEEDRMRRQGGAGMQYPGTADRPTQELPPG